MLKPRGTALEVGTCRARRSSIWAATTTNSPDPEARYEVFVRKLLLALVLGVGCGPKKAGATTRPP